VTPGYLSALGIRLLAGRDVSLDDVATGPRAIIVSEKLAKRVWPNESAIGKQLRSIGPTPTPFTVVGVAADVTHDGLNGEASQTPDVYLSVYQSPPRSPALVTVFVRTSADGVPRAGETSVGELAKTKAPLPVSSLITPASSAEVVAAKTLSLLAV